MDANDMHKKNATSVFLFSFCIFIRLSSLCLQLQHTIHLTGKVSYNHLLLSKVVNNCAKETLKLKSVQLQCSCNTMQHKHKTTIRNVFFYYYLEW